MHSHTLLPHVPGFIASISFMIAAMSVGVFELLRGPRRDPDKERELVETSALLTMKTGELDELNAQWRALVAAVSDPIFIIDRQGDCHAANVPAERLFPMTDHQSVLGMTQSPDLDAMYREARMSGGVGIDGAHSVTREVTLRYPKELVVHVSIYPITPPLDNEPPSDPSFIVILRDLTDLRRLELVRRDFVANVSHELRTPLSSIKAMAETLIDGALHDQEVATHFLETIIRESDRLVRLSADLLDLSRVESRPVAKAPVDLAALVVEIASRLAAHAKEASVTLDVDIPQSLVAPCDDDEIAQVLVNLLDNAIKYTPAGGWVRLSAVEMEAEIIFSVEDSGIGILQQDLARLFERFYRADKARSRASGGTGLGLAIVKHIVERHGGRVWVESEYNKGSTFSFSVPKE